jgi:CMP-N,N'-diacetyllegionaminic acid synthase
MKKKVLIIGYGSIGRKHNYILKKFLKNKINTIKIFTKQRIKNSLVTLNQVLEYDPDYIIVSNETSKHFTILKFIEKNFINKIILVEKPLFHKNIRFNVRNNLIFVGYNLRFHPIIDFIIKKIENKIIYFVKAECFSYLPNWRKNLLYSKSSSAFKKSGGGVLLDLSHELDYLNFIFKIKKIYYVFNSKISDLNINTDDFLLATFLGKGRAFVSLTQTYFSRLNERSIFIDGKNISIKADFIKNEVILKKNKFSREFKKKFKIKKNDTYLLMHKAILDNNFKKLCSYDQARNLMKLINLIKNKNL